MTETDRPIATLLPARGVLALGGTDSIPAFLQGLVSNDAAQLSPERAFFAALLTPQGKFLHELIIAEAGAQVLIDTEAGRLADLQRRLTMYRLRAKITIGAAADLSLAAVFGPGAAEALGLPPLAGQSRPVEGGVAFVDPRLADLGVRLIAPRAAIEQVLADAGLALVDGADAYDLHRLILGVPDGSRDIAVDRGFLLESNFEELNGVSFTKGCYVGQELTARTKHRATIRKRLFRVDFDPKAPPPEPDTPVMLGGHEAGVMRSAGPGVGLALLRLEDVEKAADASDHVLTAGDLVVHAVKPAFVVP